MAPPGTASYPRASSINPYLKRGNIDLMDSEIETGDVLDAVGGTVDDLKGFVESRELAREDIEQLLDAEKKLKDRKTAKEFLLEKKDNSGIDELVDTARTDVEEIKEVVNQIEDTENLSAVREVEELDHQQVIKTVGDTVEHLKKQVENGRFSQEQLQELLEAERALKDRKTAEEYLENKISEKKLEDDLREAEEDVEELEEDIENIEEDSSDLSKAMTEISEENSSKEEELADAMKEIAAEEESEKAETGEETEEETEEEDEQEETEGEKEAEDKEKESGEESDENSDVEESKDGLEKKKEILDQLEADLTEEQLKDISIEELKRLKEEKEEKEKLVEELQDDLEDETLRKASLEDLRKVKKELEDQEEPDEKEREELEEEAEEDLQMLMGAVGSKSEEQDEGRGIRDQLDQIKDIRGRVKGILGRDEETEEEEGVKKQKVLELLDQYRELDVRPRAIKTAHIMKGYLEYKYSIERELTYKELADELEDKDGKSLNRLMKIFRKLHKDEYSGQIEGEEVKSIVEVSEEVIEEAE